MKYKVLGLLLSSFAAYSQNTLSYSSIESVYNNGVELYEKRAYSSARKEFQNYIELSGKSLSPNKFNLANAAYYSTMVALNTKSPNADIEVERFVLNYGDHPKAKTIYSNLGDSYFEGGDYQQAIKYYTKALENRVDNLDTYEIRYQLGLAYYIEKDYKNALKQFNYVKGTVIPNAGDAAYYAAVINFQNGDYDLALDDLRRVENMKAYRAEVPNWIGQILYRQKKYDEFLAYAEPIIMNPDGRKYEDLALLAGEVSFFKDNYEKAAIYYDKFKAIKKVSPSPQVTFRHAFSLYKIEQYKNAAALFKNIAGSKDEMGQQAAYYLAISALRLGDLNSALAAFDAARKLDFDTQIKEEAEYNYVKVLVENGNNQQAIVDLQNYVKNYPNGKYVDQTNELLSEILFETNNYVSAITYIESLKRVTPKINEAYQKLAYSQGIVDFNAEKFKESVTYFDKSLSKPLDKNLNTQAKFWKAEALSQLEDKSAKLLYAELLSSSDKNTRLKSTYSLAYIYFNDGEYNQALRLFRDFKTEAGSDLVGFVDDANLRIGDCYLVNKNFSEALSIYDNAYRNNKTGKDYALYQKGMALKYLGREAEAKSTFNNFTKTFANSRLLDDVLFQNGNLAMEAENYSAAINIYTNLLRKSPTSELVPQVVLKRGIAYSNIGNHDKAISDFKLILNKFGNTPYAQEAFLGIREALSEANRSEEFFEIAEEYKKSNPEGTSVQGLQFETAKDLFYNNKFDKAISAFTRFINEYQSSVLIPEANFLLAESYRELGNKQQAIKYYQEIVMGNQLEFLSQAAMRSAVIYFEDKKYNEAIQNYLQVSTSTSNQREIVVAYEGLMKSYFEIGDNARTAEYADKILQTGGNVVIGAVNRAELYKGKALMAAKDYEAAKKQFEKTIAMAKDEAGAEAKYRIGEIQYLKKSYNESIKTMQELANNYADYIVWYEKAFLLIADNYIGLNDAFMAKATLNSIIENSETPEIVAAAKQKLNSIK